jgi:phosphomannomutase
VSVPGDLRARVEAWIALDPDPATRRELADLLAAGDAAALGDRFAHPLRFGTAGLRGELGAGPARINRAVVRRTSAGLARWVLDRGPAAADAGVVVGRDMRHGSAVFAADTAEVLAAAGVRTHVFARPLPTPITAFAVRHLGAAAGVMVTASHNPAADNGYKVYAGDGAQVIPPDDTAIAAGAEEAPAALVRGPAVPTPPPNGGPDAEVLDAYRRTVLGLLDPEGPRDLRTVYTPMHGVGGAVLPDLLVAAGFDRPVPVPAQAEPDPDFPTVAFPNPEEPGALDLAVAEGRRADADLVLANDPDADRLAVAVAGPGGAWRRLSGDELGALLAAHRLAQTSGGDRLVATTIVSSTLLRKLAAEAGVAYEETLTGFKWIARAARRRPGHRLVFGYEEALGYAVSDATADKDGLSAAALAAEMAARPRPHGRTLLDLLDGLFARLGVHLTSQWSRRVAGPDGMELLTGIVGAWRRDPPATLGAVAVSDVVDYLPGAGGLPPTDALGVHLGEHGRVVLRPSGTEPKLKIYIEATTAPPGTAGLADARRHAANLLGAIRSDVAARCG